MNKRAIRAAMMGSGAVLAMGATPAVAATTGRLTAQIRPTGDRLGGAHCPTAARAHLGGAD